MLTKEKLKYLRKKQNLTQEEVAEQLGIWAQTVSKWERGLLSPDIDLLPKLAVLYRTSIDAMFDMESCWDHEHRKEFEEKIKALNKERDYEGVYRAWIAEIELRPDCYSDYPSVMLYVLRNKMFDDAHIKRMLLLAEHAERYCFDDDIRNEIHRLMLQICSASDDPEIKRQAKDFYQKLPLLKHSREIYAGFVMTKDEYTVQTKKNILYSSDLAECAIRQLISPEMPDAEKLYYYQKAAAVYENLLDGKYGGFYEIPMLSDYAEIAKCYSRMGERERAKIYVEKILFSLERQVEMTQKESSVFIHDTAPKGFPSPGEQCKKLLRSMLNSPELCEFTEEIQKTSQRYNSLTVKIT